MNLIKCAMDSTNKETIFDELSNFEKKKLQDVTPLLEDYLGLIAKTGNTIFPWMKLRPLFRHKMDKVITEFNVAFPANDLPQSANVDKFDFEDMHVRLLKTVDEFSGTPFTIQRLCELVISPYKQYKRADKFMRALEKDLLVVSTIDPMNQKNKIDPEYSSLVNGVTVSTTSVNGTTGSPHHSSSSSDDSSRNTDENSKGSVSTSDETTQSSSSTSIPDSALVPMESELPLEMENPIPDSSSKLPDEVETESGKLSETMNQREVTDVPEEPPSSSSSSSSISSEPIVEEPDEPIVPIQDGACEQPTSSEGLSIVELPLERCEPDAQVSTAETLEPKVESPQNEVIRDANLFAEELADSSAAAITTAATTSSSSSDSFVVVAATSSSEDVAVSMEAESENIVESSMPATITTTAATDEIPTEVEKMEQD